jgi:hypothetical protein
MAMLGKEGDEISVYFLFDITGGLTVLLSRFLRSRRTFSAFCEN